VITVTTGKLIGRVMEVEFIGAGMMDVLCGMEDGSEVSLHRVPDTRLGSHTVVEITYRFETPEAH